MISQWGVARPPRARKRPAERGLRRVPDYRDKAAGDDAAKLKTEIAAHTRYALSGGMSAAFAGALLK